MNTRKITSLENKAEKIRDTLKSLIISKKPFTSRHYILVGELIEIELELYLTINSSQ